MASRRTRIKGIANIPQRRQKAVSEEKNSENDNLTNGQDEDAEKQPLPDPVKKPDDTINCNSSQSNKELDSNVPQDSTILRNSNVVTLSENSESIHGESVIKSIENQISAPDTEAETNIVPQIVQQPKPPIRRRTFIKPPVSASVINRRSKQNLEKDHTETSAEKSPSEVNKIEAAQHQSIENNLKESQPNPKNVSNVAHEVTLDEVHLTPQIGLPQQEVGSSGKLINFT